MLVTGPSTVTGSGVGFGAIVVAGAVVAAADVVGATVVDDRGTVVGAAVGAVTAAEPAVDAESLPEQAASINATSAVPAMVDVVQRRDMDALYVGTKCPSAAKVSQ